MSQQAKHKYKVFWWVREVGGQRKQGSDIVETEQEDFDDTDAEELAQKDLEASRFKLGGGTGAGNRFSWYYQDCEEEGFKPNLPNFFKAHKEMYELGNGVSNWGIRKVKEC